MLLGNNEACSDSNNGELDASIDILSSGRIHLDPCFEKIKASNGYGRTKVRCSVCFLNKKTVLMNTKLRNKLPAICSEEGTIPRNKLLNNHLASIMHKECIKVHRLSKLSNVQKSFIAPMDKIISTQNHKLSQKIAELMCTVFNDAKRGTLSGWSWPSREVAALKRKSLNIHEPFEEYTPQSGDLQYINPTGYRDLLKCIVQSDINRICNKLETSLAISLRVDGSVDRMQLDNIHVLAKIVNSDGDTELIFIGFHEPESKGAIGYYNAIKSATKHVIPWNKLMPLISSIVTDGASINTGEKNGLWALLEKDKKSLPIPLLKVWCAVHRSALAWESLTANVIKIKKLIDSCSSISTYFHRSGLRTKELQQTAVENNLTIIRLPKYFEVRWTEFTYSLIYSVLRNWRPLVLFFSKKVNEEKCKVSLGFLNFLINYNHLKLLCFVSDLGYIFSRYQK